MRAPLRVALGGGGTDLPSYYREHGGPRRVDGDRQVRPHDRLGGLPAAATCSSTSSGRRSTTRARCATRSCARRSRTTGRAARSSWPPSATRRPVPASARPARTRCARSRRSAALAGRELDAGPSWPRPPATSRSSWSAARSASRTSTRRPSAGCAPTASSPDGGVDARELELSDGMRAALRERFLLFFTGQQRSASQILGSRAGRGGAAPAQGAGRRDLRGARGRRPGPRRRADERALGGQAPAAPPARSPPRWTSCATARCAPARTA